MKTKKELILTLFCILVIASILKVILLLFNCFPFNADEAVVGLMARHILHGERPVFFYGQSYMGSLDAFLVSIAFSVLGIHVWVIRAVQIILYLFVIVTSIEIAHLVFMNSNAKWMVAALLAIPPVNVTLYTTVSLGGYGEALLIGNLILLIGILIIKTIEKPRFSHKPWLNLLLGGLMGLGLWANALTLIYTIPTLLHLIWVLFQHRNRYSIKRIIRNSLIFLLGLGIGALPWWLYALQNGFHQLISEMLGAAVAVEKGTWLERTGNHFLSLIILGGTVLLGLRPPWEVRWLALPLIPIVVFSWGWIFSKWLRSMINRQFESQSQRLFLGVILVFCVGFLFTSFGVDPSGRYFVPLWIMLTLIAAGAITSAIKNQTYQIILVATILIFNLTGTIQCALRNPPGITTQFDAATVVDHRTLPKLITFLKDHNEQYGYSNYWVAYPLAFLSDEEIIFIPGLPYHQDLRYTPRDNRYLPYTERVMKSQKVAYITTHHPLLEEYLREKFTELQIMWLEETIGDYHIFYNLSKPIQATELGLGFSYP